MSSDPINAPCRRDYFPAVHTSGTRPKGAVKWIVMHDEEAPTAESAARYFQNPEAGGSAHICVDDKTCYRCLPDSAIPWGAPGANTNGFHIEQAGYAAWTNTVWRLKHIRTLRRAAYKAALACKRFDIPPVFIFAPQLLLGQKGITTHAECTKAFGGTHTDPGAGWPRRMFIMLVRRYHAKLR
jgi:hypothetical protein